MIYIFASWLGLAPAFATAPPVMTVWTRNSADFLRSRYPNHRIDYLDQRTVDEDMHREGYVQPIERDKLVKRLGLTRALAKHDELDKDLLFMYLRDANVSEMTRLRKKFPGVSLAQMKRIKTALGATR